MKNSGIQFAVLLIFGESQRTRVQFALGDVKGFRVEAGGAGMMELSSVLAMTEEDDAAVVVSLK
jgi:hypothetical protein